MRRGVQWSLVSSLVLVALITLAGCSHYLMAEREPWRHEAESSCLASGAVKETPDRVRITTISGPGACGIDYPIRVSALGESAPLSYDDEAARPPGSVPTGSMPQPWPGAQPYGAQSSGVQSTALPPLQQTPAQAYPSYPVPQSYPAPQSRPAPQSYPQAESGQPLSLDPPGLPPTGDIDDDIGIPGGPPHPYYGGSNAPLSSPPAGAQQPLPPLGPPSGPMVTAAATPVGVQPPATLACPIVSALDQWISTAVQPAALHWFRQPVVQIKQISAYSCRGMNGDPNAHISEHAFGNALDVAEFDLADGHKISVQYGWHGTPEEQGFLHDVQAAACGEFTTVLAPGANVYHYNHIHVDLMRHYEGRHICEPAAVSGEVVAERARSHFASQHSSDPGVTGSIRVRTHRGADAEDDDDKLPDAEPGDD
jgi:hypothetical protein